MGLGRLQCLLFDCTGAKAKRGYYYAGCFTSGLAAAASLTSLISFFIEYLDGEALYYSLPRRGHWIGYLLCLVIALVASLPPLVLGLLAAQNLSGYEKQQTNLADRLCSAAKFENFYCHGSATRYLLIATLSAATIILCNTLSVCVLHAGISSLFQQNSGYSFSNHNPIDLVQQRLGCCGLSGPDDYRRLSQPGVPKSCASSNHHGDDESARTAASSRANITLINSDGCASILTGEQAVICGISNMLAFTGILLLLAAWTRVERVAELTARDVRNLFKEPRAPAEAAAFVERIGRQRNSRLSVQGKEPSGSGRTGTAPPGPFSDPTMLRNSIHGVHTSGRYQRPLISDAFLFPSDDKLDSKKSISRSSKLSKTEHNSSDLCDLGSGAGAFSTVTYTGTNSSSSSSGSSSCKSGNKSPTQSVPHGWSHIANCSLRNEFNGSNFNGTDNKHRNNSALDLTKPWIGAQVINSLTNSDWTEALVGITEISEDIVQLTDEIADGEKFHPLDVKELKTGEGIGFCQTVRRGSRSRIPASASYCEPCSNIPQFLFDYSEARWTSALLRQHEVLEMPYCTDASASFMADDN